MLIFVMAGSCNNHFGICVINLKQRRNLSLKSLFITDIIRHLNIKLLIAFYVNKIKIYLI